MNNTWSDIGIYIELFSNDWLINKMNFIMQLEVLWARNIEEMEQRKLLEPQRWSTKYFAVQRMCY